MPRAPARPRPAERYRLRFRRLRRAARALVFENGALCDEVARLEAKWLRARDERRFLLARLLRLRAAAAGSPEETAPAADGGGGGGGRRQRRGGGARGGAAARPGEPRDEARPGGARAVGTREAAAAAARTAAARDGAGDGLRAAGIKEEPREAARPAVAAAPRDGPRDEARPNGPRAGPKLDAAPAAAARPPEDTASPAGPRPPPRRRGAAVTLPVTLGPLTVHSLGAAGGGAGPGAALPLGFRSSRLFASCRRPARRCLYTCRIAAGPRCEIVAEDEPGRVLAAATPDLCHRRLLQALAEAGGRPRAAPPGAGDDFFGLTHPAVRRLLRGEAGAFLQPEEEEEEEEEEEDEEDDDDDEEDEEEEEEEEGAAPAFAYADVFLGSPAGSDE